MKYRRALLLVELGQDAHPALGALRLVAPGLERLVVVAWLPAPAFTWFSTERVAAPDEQRTHALEALRLLAGEAAASTRVLLVPELGREALAELCRAEELELLVLGARSLQGGALLYEVRRERALALLYFAQGEPAAGPVRELACFALGQRAWASVQMFLRDHAGPALHATLLGPGAPAPDELAALRAVAGIEASVEGSALRSSRSALRWLEELAPVRPPQLLVVAQLPLAVLLGAPWPAPVLLVAPGTAAPWHGLRTLDVADCADDGGPLRLRIDYAEAVGDLPPVPDQALAFVHGGQLAATVTSAAGQVELPPAPGVSSLGVYRVGEQPPVDPLAAVELQLAVIRPGEGPLILFDAELADESLLALSRLTADQPLADLLAVRLRPSHSCRSIRERLRAANLTPRVLDARAVLDEGEALDVSATLDAVRLARVAARLRRAGFGVTAIVHRGPLQPLTTGFVALDEAELGRADQRPAPLPAGTPPEPEPRPRIGASPASPLVPGNRIELELDNARARGWLLEAIGRSTQSVHLQVYMAEDDDVGGAVEQALAEAGRRGVMVRVLVDSLHALHGSFGTDNPLLARLAARPGVELRAWHPITELPSLVDLKQRDHRKLVVVDGRVALIGGRNLAHEYYTGFDELPLTPTTPWRQVPWLDAGARLEGPLVAAVAAAFAEAWAESGGGTLALTDPPVAGSSTGRLVVHHGLRDASTLEAYLELIESARTHLYAVNGFPLLLELQHALLRAVRRGVKVRALFGHVVPSHGGQLFEGGWTAPWVVATELVHSRLDPLVAAGGEAYLLALQGLPGWAPGLGLVHPHVHAKLLSVDGQRCAVGSANLDVTSAYWESELVLLVEDAGLARDLEARLAALIAGSIRVQRDSAAWQELANRRTWMRHWPGVLSV